MRLPKTPRYTRVSLGANGDTGRRNVCHISFATTDLRAPIAASATAIAASLTLNTSAVTDQPFVGGFALDVPRNVTVTLGGTTASIGSGNIVVTGTDVNGAVITENLAVTAATGGLLTGLKAFKTVTDITYPATSGAGATSTVGVGSKLGLATNNLAAGVVRIWAKNPAGPENNSETLVAASASALDPAVVSNNTVTLSGTLDAGHLYKAYVLNYNWKIHPAIGDNFSSFGLK